MGAMLATTRKKQASRHTSGRSPHDSRTSPPETAAALPALRLLHLGLHPSLKLLRGIDRQISPHSVMPQTAELRAADLVAELVVALLLLHVVAGHDGNEPHRRRHPGNRVLLHAHLL